MIEQFLSLINKIAAPILEKILINDAKKRLNNSALFLDKPESFSRLYSEFQEFILDDTFENYFEVQTRIKTNRKSIPMYIQFKQSLGKNFGWNIIKRAERHLEFDDHHIIVNTRNLNAREAKFHLGLILVSLISIVLVFSVSNLTLIWSGPEKLIFRLGSIFIFYLIMVLTYKSIDSFWCATIINKELNIKK